MADAKLVLEVLGNRQQRIKTWKHAKKLAKQHAPGVWRNLPKNEQRQQSRRVDDWLEHAPRHWRATLEQQRQRPPEDGQHRTPGMLTDEQETTLWEVVRACKLPLRPLEGLSWRRITARSADLKVRVDNIVKKAKYFQLALLSLQAKPQASESIRMQSNEPAVPMRKGWRKEVPQPFIKICEDLVASNKQAEQAPGSTSERRSNINVTPEASQSELDDLRREYLEVVKALLIENHLLWSDELEVKYPALLLSSPGCKLQLWHRDFPMWLKSAWLQSLGVLLGLENPEVSYIDVFDDDCVDGVPPQIQRVELPPGTAVVFSSNTFHRGGAYQLFNGRYHAYLIHRRGPHVGHTVGKHTRTYPSTTHDLVQKLHDAAAAKAQSPSAPRNKSGWAVFLETKKKELMARKGPAQGAERAATVALSAPNEGASKTGDQKEKKRDDNNKNGRVSAAVKAACQKAMRAVMAERAQKQ